jgi:thiol-disulfide isomerase/thioredoxin
LRQLSDGTYFADVDYPRGGKMGYRLIGLVKDSPLSVPGTFFDEMTLDANGRYVSVLKTNPGRVRILFDPAMLPRTWQKAEIIFGQPDSRPARIAAIDREIIRHQRDYYLALSVFRAAGHDEKDFQYDWSDTAASLKQRLLKEKDVYVRQALYIGLLGLRKLGSPDVDRGTAQQALTSIPADSPVWELAPGYLLFDTIRQGGGLAAYGPYFQKVVTANPSREVRALTLEQAYNEALSAKDLPRAKDYYRRLTVEFADLLPGQRVKSKPPESKFSVGKSMPAFRFVSFDDPKQVLTNEMFAGKTYLVDFWATWCLPCVAEMEDLHKLPAFYQKKGLEILSVSFDRTREDVTLFRREKWKMPWHHAFVGMDEFRVGSEFCDYFELTEIPKAILVDRSGMIVAEGDEALGAKLAANLAKLLGE